MASLTRLDTAKWEPLLLPLFERGMTSWGSKDLIAEAVRVTAVIDGGLDETGVKVQI